MNIPSNLKYTNEHQWVQIEGERAIVGVTHFAQNELGDIVFVEIAKGEEEQVNRGDILGSIEAVKTISDIFIPISGKVIGKNRLLENNPGIINSDPYGKGWIIKMKISLVLEVENLLSPEEYKKLVS